MRNLAAAVINSMRLARALLVLAASFLPVSDGFAAPADPTRRVRYTGKYPKKFAEKHKEQAGDAATIARVLLKGGTPAGSHVPIMATACLAHLGLVEGETEIETAAPSLDGESELVAVDCTLGFGGHSGLMLDALSEWSASNDARRASLASFDQDGVELAKTEARLRARDSLNSDSPADLTVRLDCIKANFATIGSAFAQRQLPAAHALLADLGCSSMQIDDPARGFTWKADGPLDMRMDTAASSAASSSLSDTASESVSATAMTAAELLVASNVSSLAALLRANSDFETADARALALSLLTEPRPKTTSELDARVRAVKPPPAPEPEAAVASGDKGRGRGGRGGKAGGKEGKESGGKGGGGKGGSGKGETVRERDGGFKALEHAKMLRSMGTKKLLRVLEEDEETADSRVRGAGGSGGASGGGSGGGGGGGGGRGAKPKQQGAGEAEKELNSRVARVMQALRIEVNGEFAALDALLASLPSVLAPSGRAVFLTFHSGEDRRVKQAMKDGLKSGAYSEISRRVVRVGREEARANPRSKCCKLRWCVRAAG